MHVKSDLLISENPIYLAGGWGWRLIYTGRAHPFGARPWAGGRKPIEVPGSGANGMVSGGPTP